MLKNKSINILTLPFLFLLLLNVIKFTLILYTSADTHLVSLSSYWIQLKDYIYCETLNQN